MELPMFRLQNFHNHERSGTPVKVMGYQSNILNWRIQKEIVTNHNPIMLPLSTNQIMIKTSAKDNYNLADWQLVQIHISK